MRRRTAAWAFIGLAIAGASGAASAATVDIRLKITLNDVYNAGRYVPRTPGPISPVIGDFSFLFDNAASFDSTTGGLNVNSFNLGYSANIRYYQPTDLLILGSDLKGSGCGIQSGTNAFCAFIYGISSTPRVDSFTFAAPGYDGYFYPGSITLEVLGPVGAVPEPATWAMMIIGFGAVGFAMRRRQKVTTRTQFA